ncbi:MAG: hypothetical protein PWQ57_1379 [Desulfovibrionales bacterium]|jgi:rubrerythrin|nr:hypothetical protein [Desulfovibrionales bacterium]
MSERLNDIMIRAAELAENAVEFYETAVSDCPEGVSKEVFQALLDDEADHLARIREMQEGLAQGESFKSVCCLDEEEQVEDVEFAFRRIVEEYEPTEASSEEEDAIKAGADIEQVSVDFYEDWVEEAEDDQESDFSEQVAEEKRARLAVLQDLEYYLDDPEGWALSVGKGSLEGV